MLTVGVQHAGDVQILLGDIEGSVQVLHGVVLGELAVVDKVGSVPMNESAEGQTVLEGQVEVLDVHVLIRRCLALAPKQQTFLEFENCQVKTNVMMRTMKV